MDFNLYTGIFKGSHGSLARQPAISSTDCEALEADCIHGFGPPPQAHWGALLVLRRRMEKLVGNTLGATSIVLFLTAASVPCAGADLRFATAGNEFRFDTGVVRGSLRGGGKSDGLTEVLHVPTGTVFTKGHGLAGFYRVFSAKHRYMPDSWAAPSEARLKEDGSVEVHWPTGETRPFEQRVVYKWSSPAAIDLDIQVRTQADLAVFEVFLASYFADQFNSARACVSRRKPSLAAAEKNDGDWQMFPRDASAVQIIKDGRWNVAPNPVDWRIRPELAMPLGVRQDPATGIGVVFMAPVQDCFAVSMPFQTEGHRSLYFSLFGRDLKSGQNARATARLVFGQFHDDAQIMELYRSYLRSLRRR